MKLTIREIAIILLALGLLLGVWIFLLNHERNALERTKNDYLQIRDSLLKAQEEQQELLRKHYEAQVDEMQKEIKEAESREKIIYRNINEKNNSIHHANNNQLDSMLRATGL